MPCWAEAQRYFQCRAMLCWGTRIPGPTRPRCMGKPGHVVLRPRDPWPSTAQVAKLGCVLPARWPSPRPNHGFFLAGPCRTWAARPDYHLYPSVVSHTLPWVECIQSVRIECHSIRRRMHILKLCFNKICPCYEIEHLIDNVIDIRDS